MKAALRQTTAEERATRSAAVVRWLTVGESWAVGGGAVAIFGGMKYEPELLSLLPWLSARGMTVALFSLEGETMAPYRVRTVDDLVLGPMGVLEPRARPENRLRVADLGTVLVPGLAFGMANGMRLGRGKGHYDRVLGHPEFLGRPVGVAFHLQLLPTVPGETHDIPMRSLLSEAGWHSVS